MTKKTFRHSITFPIELREQLDYITQHTGQSTSQVIVEICTQSIPELYKIVQTAVDAKGDPEKQAILYAMRKITDVVENG